MDPSLSISSPFYNEVNGREGAFDDALMSITASTYGSLPPRATGTSGGGSAKKLPSSHRAQPKHGLRCSVCGEQTAVTGVLPSQGMFICRSCSSTASQSESVDRVYPAMTFKCCPRSTDGGDGVVRCVGCGGWYHFSCMEIHDHNLRQYLALTTTKWYCPEPGCSEVVIAKHSKSSRR